MPETSTSNLHSNTCTCVSMKSRKKCKSGKKICGNWGAAILDAQQKISELTSAIAVFRGCEKRGEPWPGSESGDA